MLAHIAVVDDEPTISHLLGAYLSAQGFRVTELHNGAALADLMAEDAPDLVLLDVGLPGEDGLSIARRLREHWGGGIIMLSGLGESIDKVVGLEVGADDYVAKPFELRELLARIKAVLRRREVMRAPRRGGEDASILKSSIEQPGGDGEAWRFEGFALDSRARRVIAPTGDDIAFTTGEFELLVVLLRHPGRVLSRDFLTQQTRGRDAAAFDRTIDMMVARLRKKLGDDPQAPRFIRSIRGAGYVFLPLVERVGR